MPSQLPLALPHRVSLSRADLVVTQANRLAVRAVDSWPDWHHSVLLIVGPAGSGKTHLLNAFVEASGATRFGSKIAGDCVADPEPVLQKPGFRIAIDDIERDPFDESDLFAIVNAARLGGGTVLATSRRHPAKMGFELADLRSRLAAATIAELGAPDDTLLRCVLVKLFADRQLDIADKDLDYLANRMDRSLEAARRLVAEIDAEALASRKRIGPGLLRRVLDRSAFEPMSSGTRHQSVAAEPYGNPTED